MKSIGPAITSMFDGPTRRMSHVYRFSSVPVIRRENVAEHSFYVSFYCLAIAGLFEMNGQSVNLAKLLKRAILHDLDESMTGDFIRIVKYSSPELKKALDGLSCKVIDDMLEPFDPTGHLEMLEAWQEAKDNSLEGKILTLVDFLSVIAYVREEMGLGNTHVSDIVREASIYVCELPFMNDPVFLDIKKYILQRGWTGRINV